MRESAALTLAYQGELDPRHYQSAPLILWYDQGPSLIEGDAVWAIGGF